MMEETSVDTWDTFTPYLRPSHVAALRRISRAGSLGLRISGELPPVDRDRITELLMIGLIAASINFAADEVVHLTHAGEQWLQEAGLI